MSRSVDTDGEDQPAAWPQLSLTEWVVLALLTEAPSHGFAIAKELKPDGDLGRIVTVHRPLVYRALDRLVSAGLAGPQQTEPGDAGPKRTVQAATDSGLDAVEWWLDQPVEHIRDLRIEFLVKLRLNERRGRQPITLLQTQRSTLADAFDKLISSTNDDGESNEGGDGTGTGHDVVDRWRRQSATAAKVFLDELIAEHETGQG